MTNAVLVPRHAHCWVCRNVAVVEDVTARLFDEDGVKRSGSRGSFTPALAYLRSIGYTKLADRTLREHLGFHARHVEAAMQVSSPAPPSALTRMTPEGGPAHWLDVNRQAMDVGMDALRSIRARLPDMADRELVAVARIGVSAAQKHGDWEAKGRKLAQVDAIIRLAAGLGGDDDAESK